MAVLEVCGFNDWLIRMLRDYRCHRVILIQPEDRKQRKTLGAAGAEAKAEAEQAPEPAAPRRQAGAEPGEVVLS